MNDHFRKRICRVLASLLIARMSRTVRAEEGPNTFEGDGGRYDLGYILEHYNVFVSGDYRNRPRKPMSFSRGMTGRRRYII